MLLSSLDHMAFAACIVDQLDTPSLRHTWTRSHSICCVASRHLSYMRGVRSKYLCLKILKQVSRSKVKVKCNQHLITFSVHYNINF